MQSIDVFNGDADGICALHQLRLHRPEPGARLVTGVKRDIRLLARLQGCTDSRITVLDVSLDRNRNDLEGLLIAGNSVFYADHHFSGPIPDAPLLEAHIDPSPRLCTSLIIDQLLAGAFRPWAIVGAYGDNLGPVADSLAEASGFSAHERRTLREIGVLLNYNGYGATEADLHVHPAELFREVQDHRDPLGFHAASPVLKLLRRGYAQDLAHADRLEPFRLFACGQVFLLPDAGWARRVVGIVANRLASQGPDMAHAILLPNADGSLQVSVRAPLQTGQGADTLCRQFATGGGRATAAGINRLPPQDLEAFLAAFATQFSP